jgi:hypothetical protein
MDSVDIEGRSGSFMSSLRGGVGHQECVLELMRQGGDLELQTNNHKWTILHATACSGYLCLSLVFMSDRLYQER